MLICNLEAIMEFKVGDRVEVLNNMTNGVKNIPIGGKGIIRGVREFSPENMLYIKWDMAYKYHSSGGWFSRRFKLITISKQLHFKFK